MKVIIIEEDRKINNARFSQSEMLYGHLKRMNIEVHIISSELPLSRTDLPLNRTDIPLSRDYIKKKKKHNKISYKKKF